ncbi:hypothetical protein [Acidiphilium acidophilum]|uniref:RepB/MobA-like C-terminal domain-containing protein n=1 Tax=Acidiphilium acidophilum TaxID=76588 RepID=A0AAW9DRA3_ACIAO|nr:hypothetical protein [Acidiphilium acidophilum]MDX5931739.1 hypothetical protein [Acidiphilium acidophilum]
MSQTPRVREQTSPARPAIRPMGRPEAGGTPDALYEVFLHDIETTVMRDAPERDMSKVDFMIAIRLRAIGIGRDAIAQIIERSTTREGRRHDWPDYARRTAGAAFGPAGDRSLEKTRAYHTGWAEIAKAAAPRRRAGPA